jgi:hypothetical protein
VAEGKAGMIVQRSCRYLSFNLLVVFYQDNVHHIQKRCGIGNELKIFVLERLQNINGGLML